MLFLVYTHTIAHKLFWSNTSVAICPTVQTNEVDTSTNGLENLMKLGLPNFLSLILSPLFSCLSPARVTRLSSLTNDMNDCYKGQESRKEQWAFHWFPLYRTNSEGTAAHYENGACNERGVKDSTWPVRAEGFPFIKMQTQTSMQCLDLYGLSPKVIMSRIYSAHS